MITVTDILATSYDPDGTLDYHSLALAARNPALYAKGECQDES